MTQENTQQQNVNPAAHMTEADLINAATLAMTQKLEQARFKGRSGWQSTDPLMLEQGYLETVTKGGDPVDVMNYAAMLYCRGQSLPKSEAGTPQQRTCEQVVLWAMDQAGIDANDPEGLQKIQSLIMDGVNAQNNSEEG